VNYKLNLLKCFACIGVVFIHVSFPGLVGKVVSGASLYAVPIFFMTAGYYAFGKNEKVIKRRLLKIIKIFCVAYALFFLYNVILAAKNHNIANWIFSNYNWQTPIKYIVFCTIDFAIPLWYLIAMIEVYLLWLFIIKNGKEKSAMKAIPYLFAFMIALTSYAGTVGLAWFWKTNFIARGMPWFLSGYYLNTQDGKKYRDIETPKLIFMIAIGLLITVMQPILKSRIDFQFVGTLPYALGLFILTLKNPNKSLNKYMEFIGEKLSLNIYILHTLLNGIIGIILGDGFAYDTANFIFNWCRPIIVLMASIAVSWILYLGRNVKAQRQSF
jgi:surface polysaccharide O-acyltransferase-like enzyme